MAKIEKTNSSTKKNSNKQPKGTMPKDKLARFKLTGNLESPSVVISRDTKRVAKSIRAISTYRQLAHCSSETKLPASLRMSAHYFLVPMSRSDSANSSDNRDKSTAVDNTASTVSNEAETDNN